MAGPWEIVVSPPAPVQWDQQVSTGIPGPHGDLVSCQLFIQHLHSYIIRSKKLRRQPSTRRAEILVLHRKGELPLRSRTTKSQPVYIIAP